MTFTSDVPYLALLWASIYGMLVARPGIKLVGHKFLEVRERWAYFFFAVLTNFLVMVPALGFMGTEFSIQSLLVFMLVPFLTSPFLVLYYRFLLGEKFPKVMEALTEAKKIDAEKKAKEEKRAAKKASEATKVDEAAQDHSKTDTKEDSNA